VPAGAGKISTAPRRKGRGLYAASGSKEELFFKALSLYQQMLGSLLAARTDVAHIGITYVKSARLQNWSLESTASKM